MGVSTQTECHGGPIRPAFVCLGINPFYPYLSSGLTTSQKIFSLTHPFIYPLIACRFSVAVLALTETNLGRKGFVSVSRTQSTTEGSQGRNPRQELKQRPQRTTANWLTLGGLLSLPASIIQDLPKDDTTYRGPSPPTSIFNEEDASQTRWQANLTKAFPQLKFSPPECLEFGLS